MFAWLVREERVTVVRGLKAFSGSSIKITCVALSVGTSAKER